MLTKKACLQKENCHLSASYFELKKKNNKVLLGSGTNNHNKINKKHITLHYFN